MSAEVKEWVKVTHSPSGMTVSVTQQSGNATAKWTVRAYRGVSGAVRAGVVEARQGASSALAELLEASS